MKKKVFIPCLGLLAAFALAFIFTACDDGTTPKKDPALTGNVNVAKVGGGTDFRLNDTVTANANTNAAAGVLRYQWQKKTGTEDWTNIPGATNQEYTINTPVVANDNIRVVVTAKGYSGNVTSNGNQVAAPNAPTLTGTAAVVRDPAGTTIRIGDTVKAEVTPTVTVETTALRYKWQKRAGTSGAFADITGATDATYTIPITGDIVAPNEYIRVVVNAIDFASVIESPAVQVEDLPQLTGTVTVARDPVGSEGTPVRIGDTVKATPSGLNEGVTPIYQWQKGTSPTGTFTDIPNAKSATYVTASPVVALDYVRVVVTATGYKGIESDAVLVRGLTDPELTGTVTFARQPAGTIRIGNTVKATVTGSNNLATFKYQWQKSATWSGTYTNIGTDSDTYVISAIDVAADEFIKVVVTAEGFTDSRESDSIVVQAAATGTMYTVTFDPEDGTLDPGTPAIWEEETGEYIYLYNYGMGIWTYFAVKPGFVFMGWYDKSDTSKTVLMNFQVNRNITLVPKWETGFTVTLVLNGGTLVDMNDEPMPTTHTVLSGNYFSLYFEPTKAGGDVFYGWYSTIGGTETQVDLGYGYVVTGDITFTAKWGPPITVTLDLAGGTLVDWYDDPVPTTYSIAPGYFSLYEEPEISGSLFAFWYKEGDSTQTPVDLRAGITVTENTTFVAKYGSALTVTLDPNGGGFYPGDTTTFSVASGGTFDPFSYLVYPPTRDGYLFAGWRQGLDGAAISSGVITVTANITLYALWLDENVLGVYANGGVSYFLAGDYGELSSYYFSNASIRPVSLTPASIDGQDATITATIITVGGTTYTRVENKKAPAYNADVNGVWIKDGLELSLEDWNQEGSAILTGGDFGYSYFYLCYVVDGNTLYLLQQVRDLDWNMLEGEVLLAIPLSGNTLQGWTKN
jgi:uncharacterized repeat protein (TIGR02543 family)